MKGKQADPTSDDKTSEFVTLPILTTAAPPPNVDTLSAVYWRKFRNPSQFQGVVSSVEEVSVRTNQEMVSDTLTYYPVEVDMEESSEYGDFSDALLEFVISPAPVLLAEHFTSSEKVFASDLTLESSHTAFSSTHHSAKTPIFDDLFFAERIVTSLFHRTENFVSEDVSLEVSLQIENTSPFIENTPPSIEIVLATSETASSLLHQLLDGETKLSASTDEIFAESRAFAVPTDETFGEMKIVGKKSAYLHLCVIIYET